MKSQLLEHFLFKIKLLELLRLARLCQLLELVRLAEALRVYAAELNLYESTL
jgi:hypothetical protein